MFLMVWRYVFCFAALIPMVEFADPHTLKKYGIKPDAETIDIVTTAAAQKEVIVLSLCFCLPFFCGVYGIHRDDLDFFCNESRSLCCLRFIGEMLVRRFVKRLIIFLLAVL